MNNPDQIIELFDDMNLKKTSVKLKKRDRNSNSYSLSILKVLKLVTYDMSISKKAMVLMNNIVYDQFERIASEAGRLARYNKNEITTREIQIAVRLILNGELAKHAISEGNKAMSKYDKTSEY